MNHSVYIQNTNVYKLHINTSRTLDNKPVNCSTQCTTLVQTLFFLERRVREFIIYDP